MTDSVCRSHETCSEMEIIKQVGIAACRISACGEICDLKATKMLLSSAYNMNVQLLKHASNI